MNPHSLISAVLTDASQVLILYAADTVNCVFDIWWIYDILVNNFGMMSITRAAYERLGIWLTWTLSISQTIFQPSKQAIGVRAF